MNSSSFINDHHRSLLLTMPSLRLPQLVVLLLLLLSLLLLHRWRLPSSYYHTTKYISAIGDPGMRNPHPRFGFEIWNFCNEVGAEAPHMGSPRLADCSDLLCPYIHEVVDIYSGNTETCCKVHHKVKESDNHLGTGDKIPASGFQQYSDPDLYAVEKELYLGSLCEVPDSGEPWQFWMIMLKNGNFDKNTTLCPENGKKVEKIVTYRNFPCFGEGCMNQPLVYHNQSKVICDRENMPSLSGGFYGTYDLDADLSKGIGNNSYFSVSWKKNQTSGSWIVSHRLTTSRKYPWLMLYLRADATSGFNGGYHYNGRGIIRKLPESPDFKVKLTLDIKQGGGAKSQFYLIDIGSCWKNNGLPCDGDVLTDVTRYSEMIINPKLQAGVVQITLCLVHHTMLVLQGRLFTEMIHLDFHIQHTTCIVDQEMLGFLKNHLISVTRIATHRLKKSYSFYLILSGLSMGTLKSRETVGLVMQEPGNLMLGRSSRLYFYQDPGTKPARRIWSSINVGTEIYVSNESKTAEWAVSDFDVLIPQDIRP